MNIQHMIRDDRSDRGGTLCGEYQEDLPLGEVFVWCQTCQGISQGRIPDPRALAEPCIVVPEGFIGSAPEAIALAVAGAVQAIADDGNLAQAHLEETVAKLSALVAAYPRTSFAASEAALEQATAWLAFLGEQSKPEPPT